MLKGLASEISPFLTLLFKKSLDEGSVPEIWKCANVTPIFKAGSKHKPENYRPISLTPVLSKIMEKNDNFIPFTDGLMPEEYERRVFEKGDAFDFQFLEICFDQFFPP